MLNVATNINLDVGVIDKLNLGKAKNVLVLSGAYYGLKSFEKFIEPHLKELKVKYYVYPKLSVNLNSDTVYAVTNFARNKNIDLIISCGGSAIMDCGKLVNLLLSQGGSLDDYLNGKIILPGLIDHITVPMLSGAGSEISPSAVFAHNKEMKVITHHAIMPRVTYIDPVVMQGLPKILWACVGFECFATAIAAYVSPKATSISDNFAKQSMMRYQKFIFKLLKDPDSVECIKEIEVAAINAFIAANIAGTGAIHAMASALNAEFNFRQGIAISMVAGEVCARSYEYNKEKFDKVLQIMKSGDDIKTAVNKHLKKIGLVVPSLKSHLDAVQFERFARACLSISGNADPKCFTVMDIVSMLKNIP